ncbi:MAG TPA: OsmC family protein [Dokdonella sp.]|jgi:organic hydroperoxide reductase OsmC/OhrA|nr:OsmC family protein [Dokdonella sp.]
MSKHVATILWQRENQDFLADRYSRAHRWQFDGGIDVAASSSPHVVPLPFSDENAIDPEEAFVASLSSCHMLWFLSLACKRGYLVESYRDEAVGRMGKDGRGRIAITEVILHPQVRFGGQKKPDAAQRDALHHAAHESCFIANSVRTVVRCEPVIALE